MKFISICRFGIVLSFILLCTTSMFNQYAAASNEPIRVYVDGYQVRLTQPPVVEDGSIWVQLLPLCDTIGIQLDWDAETQTITGSFQGLNIVMNVNSTEVSINGKLVSLPFAPRIIDDTILIPLEVIREIQGDITWDDKDNRVDIVIDKSYYSYQAAMNNDLEKVRYWLTHEGGANFANRDDGLTTLSFAMHHKNTAMIELLLKYGADPNHSLVGSSESIRPLISAVLDKDPTVVQLLLEYGADVNHQTGEGTALQLAKKNWQKGANESEKQKLQQIITLLEKQQDIVSSSEQRVLIPFNGGKKMDIFTGETGTWGYIDNTGKVTVKPKFAIALPFSEGLAYAVSKDGRQFGYIDRTGKFVLRFEFRPDLLPGDFKEGLAPVGKNKKWGFIDKQGIFVIAPEYDYVSSFSEGFAVVESNKKKGLINHAGEMVVEPTYESIHPFHNGMALVRGDRRGFIDTKGELVIDFDKLEIFPYGEFDGEYAPVYKDGKIGMINREGQFMIPPIYNKAFEFHEGLASVSLDGKYGYIDRAGQIMISPQFDFALSFRNGQALVQQNGKWGFINRKGEMIVPPTFDGFDNIMGGFPLVWYPAFSDQSDGMAMLHKGNQIFYVLPDGKIIEFQKQ